MKEYFVEVKIDKDNPLQYYGPRICRSVGLVAQIYVWNKALLISLSLSKAGSQSLFFNSIIFIIIILIKFMSTL